MRLGEALANVADAPRPESLETFRKDIPEAWIHEALAATGTATMRRRRLPAEQVLWLVLSMAFFRNRSIVDVAESLDLVLPGSKGPSVGSNAISQARARLGAAPVRWIFETCSAHWAYQSADAHRFRGLALFGADGTSMRVPDTPENNAHFGAPKSGRDGAGYPQLRLVGLFALRSHLLVRAAFGPYRTGEPTYARELWPSLPDHSLCILDRNYLAAPTLIPLAREGVQRHWLTRAKKNTKWHVLGSLGRNDFLVEMKVSATARRQDPSLPETWTVRAIRYQRKGFQSQWLLTSLLDPEGYPAGEIVDLYHERWEVEMAFDEVKTEVLDREEAIRSKSPKSIEQEVWGILLAYNLVRLEMERVANEAGVPPTCVSFITSLHLIRDECVWAASASPGAIPRHLRNLRANLARFILPPRRSDRSYPRAVKIKMSNYPRKRPAERDGDVK